MQLDGGNDALNTVIPYMDPNYEKLRPKLKIATSKVVRLSDTLGLHPSLKPLDSLLQAGHLAVVPGVGYPNPNRSHFASMAIWHTARFDPEERKGYGWLDRALDAQSGTSYAIGASVPGALRGRRSTAVALSRMDDLLLADPTAAKQVLGPGSQDDLLAYIRRKRWTPTAAGKLADLARGEEWRVPGTGLAERLKLVSRLLKSDLGAHVFHTVQGRLRDARRPVLYARQPAVRVCRRHAESDGPRWRRAGR